MHTCLYVTKQPILSILLILCSTLVKDNPGRVNAHLNTHVKRVLFAKDHTAVGIELVNGTQVLGDRVVWLEEYCK